MSLPSLLAFFLWTRPKAKSLLLLSVVFVVCSFVLTFCFYLISTSPTSFTKRIRPQCHNNNHSHNGATSRRGSPSGCCNIRRNHKCHKRASSLWELFFPQPRLRCVVCPHHRWNWQSSIGDLLVATSHVSSNILSKST